MAYIYNAAGVANAQVNLEIQTTANTAGNLSVTGLQDVTVNNANDVFTWEQLDTGSKLQVPTTATNSITTNLVLDQAIFFGANASAAKGDTATDQGIFGLSKNKTKVNFALYFGDEDDGTAGPEITGQGYITGLAPTVSAGAPVWVSPVTLTVDGDYTPQIDVADGNIGIADESF